MTKDVREVLAEIQDRAERAVDGPWRARLFNGEMQVVDFEDDLVAVTPYDDNEFIAAARTDVPRLVAFAQAVLNLADELNEARMEANDLALDGEYDAYTKAWDGILTTADAYLTNGDES